MMMEQGSAKQGSGDRGQGRRARGKGREGEERRTGIASAFAINVRGLGAMLMLVVLAAACAPGTLSADEPDATAINTAIKSISADKLQRFVNILADDPFEGRETGSRGGVRRGRFSKSNWKNCISNRPGPMGTIFKTSAPAAAIFSRESRGAIPR